jgi:N-acetylmuramoyl-L-alanine amidase
LDERIETARRRGADLFISLHFNAASASEVRGSEVYCLTPARTASTNARGEGANTGTLPGNLLNEGNLQLAYQIQRALVSRLGMEDRGVRRARWAVLRPARMPAVLVEGGFMSNPSESRNIGSSAWRSQLASAILEGVKSYQKRTTTERSPR